MHAEPSHVGRIFALVGPSGCGKTALIEEMLRRFPADLVVMRSLTTRPRREAEDDRNTRFVSDAEFLDLQAAGALVQWVEYNGNFYGDARADVDEIIVTGRSAIRPLVETAVSSFRAQGYRVALVRITPGGEYANRSPERAELDATRMQEAAALTPDIEISNRFEAGGFESACDELARFITEILKSDAAANTRLDH